MGSFRQIQSLAGHTSQGVKAVAFSPDGRYLVTGGEDFGRVYEVGSFQQIQSGTGGCCIAFSPDGRYLASGSGHIFNVYGVGSFRNIQTLQMWHDEEDILAIAFSPDGRYLATGSDDETILWWKSIISRQEFEEQDRRRIEVEK